MLFYHIDHSGSLYEGMSISPHKLIERWTDWPVMVSLSVTETFGKKGLSNFGLRVLSPANSEETISGQQFEFILEYVRLRFYSCLPSRLSSFYGIPDCASSFDRWKERFGKDASTFRIFECESSTLYIADASLLDHHMSEQTLSGAVSALGTPVCKSPFPAARLLAAHQYWKSCIPVSEADLASSGTLQAQCSHALFELLAPERVRVLRQLPLP